MGHVSGHSEVMSVVGCRLSRTYVHHDTILVCVCVSCECVNECVDVCVCVCVQVRGLFKH